ncbi:MAG: hypothetical protein IKP49_11200 [Treponema sp.]|nr:hypothetical protein [Treponema sp.]MBR6913582.1 hypothetical protein [Treponema sp.]
MKKFFMLAAFSLILAANFVSEASAENMFHIGGCVPFSHARTRDSNLYRINISESGVGFSFDFTHVADCGFTIAPWITAGLIRAKSDWIPSLADTYMTGFENSMGIGLGGSPIHNEKRTLTVLGKLGFRSQDCDIEKDIRTSKEIHATLITFCFSIGTEIIYTQRFTEHIGMFFSTEFYLGAGEIRYEVTDAENQTYRRKSSGGGVQSTFQPRIGLAVTL